MPQQAARLFENIPPDVCHLFKGTEPRAERVVELLKYKKSDVAEATSVPISSIRYDAKMPAELRERIVEWAIALNLVGSFFKDEQRTLLWFQVPNPLLGGVAPRDMIRVGRFKKLLKFIQTALSDNTR
ncbi:MAG: hypothetical protein ACRELY_00095 [Polyangiaceae bacterium]